MAGPSDPLKTLGKPLPSGTWQRLAGLADFSGFALFRCLRSRCAGRASGRRRLCRSSALQWSGTLQRPSALKRTGALLRTLTWLRRALVALRSAGRALRLLGLTLLGRRLRMR